MMKRRRLIALAAAGLLFALGSCKMPGSGAALEDLGGKALLAGGGFSPEFHPKYLKAAHNSYDEGDPATPDAVFQNALDLEFYNLELDAMVDGAHSVYTTPDHPAYLTGELRLYIKHVGSSNPGTRDFYKYVEDLSARSAANGGSLYGDGVSVVLSVDLKGANSPDWPAYARSLKAVFDHYPDLFSSAPSDGSGGFVERAVTVCLTGESGGKNAYLSAVNGSDRILRGFTDGSGGSYKSNPADYFTNLAPVYQRFLSLNWSHVESGWPLTSGSWSNDDQDRLNAMLAYADQAGVRMRFYCVNGNPGLNLYTCLEGMGGARQRWAQFIRANRGLGLTHFIATDDRSEISELYDDFGGILRSRNQEVENMSGGHQNGVDPDIVSLGNGKVAEVHKANGSWNLWYSVGSLSPENTLVWHTNYDLGRNGRDPDLAVTDYGGGKALIQVNKSHSSSYLWYNIGFPQSDNTIDWTTNGKIKLGWSHKKGDAPSVAASGNRVVQVNKSEGNSKLFFNSGEFTGSAVDWKRNERIMNHSGYDPHVYLEGDRVIVTFEGTDGKLRYCTGTLGSNWDISWHHSSTIGNQEGEHPSLTVAGDDRVVEIHESPVTGKLWANTGTLTWPSISWKENYIWDGGTGSGPRTAYDESADAVIEIHRAQNNYGMWTNTGRLYP